MKINPLHAIDFYKADHRRQYPEGTTMVYSNFTARSNKHSNLPNNNDKMVFFGLQYFIKHFLMETFQTGFFDKPKYEAVKAYKRRMDTSLGEGAIPVEHIEALHDLQYLPIEIRALPEGTRVPMKVPCMTIHNTHPDFFWLTNYLETILSCYLWKMCVSATTADWYRNLFDKYALLTGSAIDFVQWEGHDFSMRGMSGPQDAVMSGAAHLTSFTGTDTVMAIDFHEDYYNADAEKELIGGSVYATEHSVMCMGGMEDELETYRRLITQVYPSGIVSIVSDTWDFWDVVTNKMQLLQKDIMAREGKLVIRPDSGDPVKIICGDPDAVKGSPEYKGAIECLWDVFGGTKTETGHKLLDSHIGLIYGDSITPERALLIMEGLHQKGFASGNVVLGIGSFTYQYVTRDTYGMAVKSTFGIVDGEHRMIFKDPKTDDNTKKSAKGLLMVFQGEEGLWLMDGAYYDHWVRGSIGNFTDLLGKVYKDGKLLRETSLREIRTALRGG